MPATTLPTKVCPHCSVSSQTTADKCPACGKGYKKRGFFARWFRRWLIAGGILLVIIALVSLGSGSDDGGGKSTERSPSSDTESSGGGGKSEDKAPALTSGQKNALRAAENYLDLSGMSKAGLIQQLSSPAGDGYSKADATYAANHVDADWNAEAVEAARNYLELTPMSKNELIQQLSSSAGDKFTLAEARYAANKVY
jgi:hypothetical protein